MTNEEVTLREFLESLLVERQRADVSRWVAHEQMHIQLEQARNIASQDINRRLDEMNQFREQINRERGEFLTKENFFTKHDELNRRIESVTGGISKQVDDLRIAKSNLDGRMWMLGWVIVAVSGAITTIINLIFKYAPK